MSTNEAFAAITDRICAQLADGVRPWAKPWRDGMSPLVQHMPHNLVGRNYRGANVLMLWAVGQSMGYASPVWLTFKQAIEAGGAVRKGERGTTVFFWKFGVAEDKATGETRQTCLARRYTVFNLEQCDGVTVPERRQRVLTPLERHAEADRIIAATGATIQYGGDRAFYAPSRDSVQLPVAEAFRDPAGFYGTAFHELGHWTGHESRLNRTFGRRFGDDAYAVEELVAELTAAFVCASTGIASTERDDHAAYLSEWLRVLRADSRAIVTAAAAAQKAADLILGRTFADAEDGTTEAEPAQPVTPVAVVPMPTPAPVLATARPVQFDLFSRAA
jgi:antirestriction protein ArdC